MKDSETLINDKLEHHGILGMRWGRRRSSNKSGSSKKKDDPSSNLEKARQAKLEKKEHDSKKQNALNKGTAKDILKFKGELSIQEMQNALGRINLEKQLSDISARETDKGSSKVNKILNKVEQVNTNVNKGINVYNTVAKINNSLSEKKLPILDGTNKKDRAVDNKKARLVKSGTPEEVVERFGDLDIKDLEDVSKRFNYEDMIRKKAKSE